MITDHSRGITTGPRIYVASLSDYNAGVLHGVWIEAGQTAEEIAAEVEAMLKTSSSSDAEEWAIHDCEGFGPIRLSEWESFDRVSALAEMIQLHGDAFVAWFADADVEWAHDLEEAFTEAYQGDYSSVANYAETMAEELGILQQYRADDYSKFHGPDDFSGVWPFSCIDWERAGRELVVGGDLWTTFSSAGVYVFRAN